VSQALRTKWVDFVALVDVGSYSLYGFLVGFRLSFEYVKAKGSMKACTAIKDKVSVRVAL
jgi:hypothetical protein